MLLSLAVAAFRKQSHPCSEVKPSERKRVRYQLESFEALLGQREGKSTINGNGCLRIGLCQSGGLELFPESTRLNPTESSDVLLPFLSAHLKKGRIAQVFPSVEILTHIERDIQKKN